MPNSPRSNSRLLTLLLVLLFCYTCTRTVDGSENLLGLNTNSVTHLQGGTRYVRKYFLYAQCSEGFVRMKPRSRKRAGAKRSRAALDARGRSKKGKYALLTFESVGHEGKIQIIGENVQRYLCFSKKGRLILRDHLGDYPELCRFKEDLEAGTPYLRLQNVHQPKWYVGFNKRGRKMKGYDHLRHGKKQCSFFTKLDADNVERGGYRRFPPTDIEGILKRNPRKKLRRRPKLRHGGRRQRGR